MGAAPDLTPNTGDDMGGASDPDGPRIAASTLVPIAARLSLPQRLRRLIVAGAAVLLALILLFASDAGLWQQALAVTGIGPSASGATDRYYLAVDVLWASVTLDGHSIRRPIIGTDPPLALARGRHHIGWQASPFEARSCTFSIPHAATDSCPVSAPFDFGPRLGQARLIALHESLANLPPAGRGTVATTVQDALDAEPEIDLVRRGETYFTRTGPVVATESLRAALHLQLDTGDDTATRCQLTLTSAALVPCALDGQDCRQFCALPFDLRIPEAGIAPEAGRYDAWLVWALVRETWDFTTLGGQPIARDQPLDGGPAADADHILLLALEWSHGAWFAVPLVTPGAGEYTAGTDTPAIAQAPVCAAALDLFGALHPASAYTWLRVSSGVPGVAGCVIVEGVGAPPAGGTPSATFEGDGAYYLERFGLLYALNVAAHRLHSDLPLAGSLQQQAARLILSGEAWPETGQ